ncbi:hypothetical protein FLAN108750_09680 [Flavobacterium antarcticum]|uniref:hypothetical protein n=1 Tax=Flavobacterium antarcticum TaxID=271155 RepID=UPI0003B77F8D|nr:hypothetical protein [Flavobacterium antarcticum]
MKKIHLSSLGLFTLALATMTSCKDEKKIDTTVETTIETPAKSEIAVTPIEDSKMFPGAKLTISSQVATSADADSVSFKTMYKVANFELTMHTEGHNGEHMANSGQGQHIHYILDNTPYAALYKPENEVKLKKGSEHYLLSFLSRSYHESLKEKDAFVLEHFKINDKGAYEKLATPTAPMLFYSRPKGEYKGADTKAILLDFFVVNTTLAKDGYKVQANVNGQDFMLDEWRPYQITGLPMGENVIKLTLMDASGNVVSGENTSVERKITLME